MEVDLKIRKATKEEAKAFKAAARHLGFTLDDPDFWYEVAKMYPVWTDKLELPEYAYREQTFKEFKEMVLSGADEYNTEKDGDIDIDVTFYYSIRKVVGYTLAGTWRTWANRNVLKGFDLADIAGHQGHEYLHNCGLGHKNAARSSVVYQWGYMIKFFTKKRLGLPNTIQLKYKRSLWTRAKRLFWSIF